MEIKVDKKIGTLIHIYDYLNGGYFSAHHQLKYYDEKAYQLYLSEDRVGLSKLYNELKLDIESKITNIIEKSAGIRYFCCDGCHDARIMDAYIDGDYFVIKLDTDGMLGCLDVEKFCSIKINTKSNISIEDLIQDIDVFDRIFWLNSEIAFDNGVIFRLEAQVFNGDNCQNIWYEFNIKDIIIE